jgi:purine-binding chemotaxis protein CheW
MTAGARPPTAGATGLRVLTFRLDGREHGLSVADVVEVVRMVEITPLPEGPRWVAGVLNYRGRVIPVIDLRARLGLPCRAPSLSTPLIVVDAGPRLAALLVDEADEVLALSADEVQPPDPVAAACPAVTALARPGKRLIVLLDAARLGADAGPGGAGRADSAGGAGGGWDRRGARAGVGVAWGGGGADGARR